MADKSEEDIGRGRRIQNRAKRSALQTVCLPESRRIPAFCRSAKPQTVPRRGKPRTRLRCDLLPTKTKRRATIGAPFGFVYLLPKVLFLGLCNTKSAPNRAAFALAAKVAICRVLRLQISPARKVAARRVLRLQFARFATLDLPKICFIWSKRFFAGNRKRPRNFVIAGLCYFIQ